MDWLLVFLDRWPEVVGLTVPYISHLLNPNLASSLAICVQVEGEGVARWSR